MGDVFGAFDALQAFQPYGFIADVQFGCAFDDNEQDVYGGYMAFQVAAGFDGDLDGFQFVTGIKSFPNDFAGVQDGFIGVDVDYFHVISSKVKKAGVNKGVVRQKLG